MQSGAQIIKNYDREWKIVADNISKGLPASALETVKKIYTAAKAEKQDAQIVKSLVYITQLQQENREENFTLRIKEIEKELQSSKEPVTSLLNSYLAGLYYQYFAGNRYKLYGRTNTVDFNKEDIATWTADDFHKRISELYLLSIKNTHLLQQLNLADYDALIEKGNVRYLRPTLYDILAHHALNYFKNDERDITKAASSFEINDAKALSPADAFVNASFKTNDSLSLQHKALLIYQDLIRFHLNDKKPDALIDVDIERLQYVYSKMVITEATRKPIIVLDDKEASPGALSLLNPEDISSVTVLKDATATGKYGAKAANGVIEISTKSKNYNNLSAANNHFTEKEWLYYTALQQIILLYGNIPATAQAQYLMALVHQQKGNEYNAQADTSNRYELLKAKKITDKILEQKEKSEGWTNAYNLNQQLLQPYFSCTTEKVNLPGQPFRMLLNFKNISKVYLRAIPATEPLKKLMQNNRGDDKNWIALAAAKAVKSWQQHLPENTDLQSHTTEIKIDALPAGAYFLLASVNEDFGTSNNILAAQLTYISNISFVQNNEDFFVLHRNTGYPLANATVQIYKKVYDYKISTYTRQKSDQYTTNKNGYFKLSTASLAAKQRGGNSLLLDIRYNNDQLSVDDDTYYYYNNLNIDNNLKFQTAVFMFTDRSIYRPGQTLHFKGIAVSKRNDGRKATVYDNYKTTLVLYDANLQKISDIQVVSNEYGSFSGKFMLPPSGLNGAYTLRTADNTGYASVRVEEYKRPKFYVDFEPVKGAYKVNEEIKITGFARAYAGNNVDGATVKYRVVREARFPYPWLFWRGYYPHSEAMEITHGEAATRADGTFDITFKAIPDAAINIKAEPVFDYRVYTDVTDINGETRSASQSVSAGYKSLLLKVKIADRLSTDSLYKIYARTENMSGEFEKANISVTITRLKPEERLLRPRYWERPDQFILSKEEYIGYFPNDIYKDEDDPKTWEKAAIVLKQDGNTDSTGQFLLQKTRLIPGYYAVEIETRDKDNQAIKEVQYIELFNPGKPEPTYPQYVYSIAPQPIEPGEKTKAAISSSAEDVFLIQQTDKENKTYSYYQLHQNKPVSVTFTATEADRGGYNTSFLFVKHNRVFQQNQTIAVPWTNKQLNIEYSTFRDKTLPGAGEKWTVKISGYKKEKVAAEMLAGMYDASLDQFHPHQWNTPSIWRNVYNNTAWNIQNNFAGISATLLNNKQTDYQNFEKKYDILLYPGSGWNGPIGLAGRAPGIMVSAVAREESQAMNEVVVAGYGTQKRRLVTGAVAAVQADAAAPPEAKADQIDAERATGTSALPNPVTQIRTNFNETAFFFPDLKTDKDGNISFAFTMPEALTRWKFQALTHTKDLAFGYSQKEIITQKDLMVQPNPPRFLREGDQMAFSGKVVNLSGKEITGIATLQLFDAATNEPVDGWFKNAVSQQYFTIAAGQSQAIQFPLEVPYQYNKALTWRIVAQTKDGALSDGEENILPVLTNRMLVTETLPVHMRGSGTKNFRFDKLINSDKSETLTTQSLTVEYTSNPVWYAVQALPYMMEYPYDCAEQTWNRYYANALATLIASSSPKIKQVFEQWKTADTAALLSNLQKNQELKAVLLEETPWVLAAKSEAQQKKNVALLFDLMRMSGELTKAYEKLRQLQSPNGGFVWFKGGPDDRYMTQYIVTGIGHLKKLKATTGLQDANLNRIVQGAMPYLDAKIKEEYDNLLKYKTDLEKYTPSYYVIQYLYMRSFFPQIKIADNTQKAVNYFKERSKKTWTKQNKYMQAMIALSAYRNNDPATPKAILQSLKETAIIHEEQGMYYKDAVRSWWWYEAPIERQALIVEAFEEAGKDSKAANDLRTWLLKNKQTNNWESTKATAEACYALLLRGTDWLSVTPEVSVDLGGAVIIPSFGEDPGKTEAGTGYFKKVIEGSKVRPAMGNITVTVQQADRTATLPTWGGVYWQYFEDLDKITSSETPLKLSKKLFTETNSDRGPVLKPVNEGDIIKVGDKIKVRIELNVDRDMEYVHMKDMRAASFEPVNVLSQYKWQGGLGYYESTKDASTNFFFNYLRKGTYVFEYALFAQLPGNYSNGITSIQCMYAPEFSSHSEGIRVRIK
ncbi:alpha-2-macroglobulin family protein [Niabella aquatica]